MTLDKVVEGLGVGFDFRVDFLTVCQISFFPLFIHFTGVFPDVAFTPTLAQSAPGECGAAQTFDTVIRVNKAVASPIPTNERRIGKTLALRKCQH